MFYGSQKYLSEPMSGSRHSPPEKHYWSTPRHPKATIKTANVDFNQNFAEIPTVKTGIKSLSEPSSPQSWHRVSSIDETVDVQRSQDKSPYVPIAQNSHNGISGIRQRKLSLTRRPSEGTELAELLAEHQERQLQSMKGLSVGGNRQWGSCSKLNELHLQTNQPQYGSTTGGFRHMDQLPARNESSAFVYSGLNAIITSQANGQSTRFQAPSSMSLTSAGLTAPLAHVKEGAVLRTSPLSVLGEGYVSTSGRASRSISPSSDDGDKLGLILRAKDDLIGQKDQIIDKQKQSIFQLQQQMQQMNIVHPQMSMHTHVTRTVSADPDAAMSLKIQECQYQNAQLRAHLADKDSSIDRLQKKLGETEYLLQNMEASVQDTTSSNRQELEQFQQKSAEHEKTIAELTSKLGQMEEDKLKLKREKQSLERYLGEVPTVEEHQKTHKTLKEVREECSRLKETVSSKDKKLARMNKAFGNKDDEAKKLTVENSCLKENVQRLQVSLDKLNNDGPVSVISFEDLKMENERLQGELERTKKMLESKHKKMKALHYQTQNEHKNLEDRLAQEEDMVTALREELVAKENSLEEIRKAVKEIASHNQDLLEENLNLQCSCEQLKKLSSKDKMDAHRTLWKELLDCTVELQAVIQVCRERREGKDPEMSVLLGLRSTSIDKDVFKGSEELDDVDAVKAQINGVKQLRSDVEDLRKFICDQYAEDIGNNCRMQ